MRKMLVVLGLIALLLILGVVYYFVSRNEQPFAGTPASLEGNTTNTYIGIYAVTPLVTLGANKSLSTTTYSLPYVDGIAIRIAWSDMEPGDGTYDWNDLDAVVNAALKNHKKLSIAVGAGDNSPAWLTSDGVNVLTFNDTSGNGNKCVTYHEPTPWDPTFIQKYAGMMQALSTHLKTIPGAYEALTMAKITGINQDTEELHMTATAGGGQPSCPTTNAPVLWQQAGYTPAKIEAAWNQLAAATNSAFPDKVLIQVILGDGFPPTDENGNPVGRNDPSPADPRDAILASGLATYGSRFGTLYDALAVQTFTDVGQTVESIEQKGGIAAYQTNHYGNGGSQCGLTQRHGDNSGVDCTETTYLTLLENGLNHHGTYFEIWDVNAQQFPDALTTFHKELEGS